MRINKRFGTAKQRRQNTIKSLEVQLANNSWREQWVLEKRQRYLSTRRSLSGGTMSSKTLSNVMARTQRELGALTKDTRRLRQHLSKLAV